jgi:hypothetical protein
MSLRVLYIAIEARAGGGDLHAVHHRLAAVMPGADGDAFHVEHHADVVGADGGVFQDEGDHAGLVLGGADLGAGRAPSVSRSIA